MVSLPDIQRLVTSLSNLPELEMQHHAIRTFLEQLPIDDATWSLGQFLRITLKEETLQHEALYAACGVILNYHREEDARPPAMRAPSYLFRIKESATRQGLDDVVMWVSRAGPERKLSDGAKLAPLNLNPSGQLVPRHTTSPAKEGTPATEVTVGHRRTLARRTDPKLISYLSMDPDPLVLREVLLNPTLRRQDLLAVASRRPTTPDLLNEVAYSKRWCCYEEVRETLILNPYIGTQIALALLPSLSPTARQRIINSQELHFMVGKFARLLNKLSAAT